MNRLVHASLTVLAAAVFGLASIPSTSSAEPARPVPAANALHVATLKGDLAAVRNLIAMGVDLNQKDAFGSTPLIVAATFGRPDVARALIDAGADTGIGNNEDSTPLHIAALLGRPQIVAALLERGANRYARNQAGHTALDTVAAPYEDMKETYGRLGAALAPLGLKLDPEQLRLMRPRIARMLQPRAQDLAAVEYTPLPGADWKISTPEAQGLDPKLVAALYLNAAELETLYGLLVVAGDHLIAEGYFNEGGVDQLSGRQSATKSFVSALVGIGLDKGCLSSVDQKMVEFFPQQQGRITDTRKKDITIRQLLQMRAGYPWEGRVAPYFDTLYLQDNWHWLPHLADFPLVANPGAQYGYSNLTSHLLAVILARACKTDLQAYAQEHLFSPMGARVPRWTSDPDGYRWGWGEIYVTARDMAKFGSLYLHGGEFRGQRILPAAWVEDSLRRYSQGINFTGTASSAAGLYLRDIGYGYQWWSARAGAHRFDFAWGHGGQLIVLLHDLDMVIVTTADPLHHLPEKKGWRYEGRILDLVGRFINSLPEKRSQGDAPR